MNKYLSNPQRDDDYDEEVETIKVITFLGMILAIGF